MHAALTATPPPPTTVPEVLDHPAARFLLDPWGTLTELAATLLGLLGAIIHDHGVWLLLVALLGVLSRWGVRRWRQARLHAHARFVEISLPPTVEPDSAAECWRHLAGLLRQPAGLTGRPHLAWEYRWKAEQLTIGLWLPSSVSARLVEQSVQAAWPGAHTHTHNPPPPVVSMPPGQPVTVVGGTLRLAGPEWWPLRTDHPSDPLRALLGAAAEQRGQQTTIVQVLARPAAPSRLARCRRAAAALRRGQSPTRRGRLLDLLLPGPATRPSAYSLDPGRAGEVRAVLDKASQPGWEAVVRYAVAAPGPRQRRHGETSRRSRAVAAAFAVYLGRNQLASRRLWQPARALQARALGRGDLLSLGELAALAHLPVDAGVAGLDRAGARAVAPAASVSRTGKVFGDADAGPPRPVALTPADARHHLHVIGATGSGKSELLAHLILQDAQAGRGVVAIDPRGDLIRDVLDRLPASAAHRLVLLDPDERDAPPAINMLEGDPEIAVEHLLTILRNIYAASWGPRTDDVLRAACLSLVTVGPATLRDVPRVLTEPAFRHRRLATLTGPSELLGFWDWYDQLGPGTQAQLIGPALSRLRGFLLRGFASSVIDATHSSVDFARVLDGGILLARLPKGLVGEDAARLLGSFVVSKVWRAALARAQAGEPARTDASLVIDEAQNFLHLPYTFEEVLAEARGYRLGLTLAHQHLGQLPKPLRDAVDANARSKLWFTLSPQDAHAQAGHVTPELTEHDLAHLGAFQAAARLVRDGVELPACTLRTRKLPPPVDGRTEQLRAAARRRYGRTATQRRRQALRRDYGTDLPPATSDEANGA